MDVLLSTKLNILDTSLHLGPMIFLFFKYMTPILNSFVVLDRANDRMDMNVKLAAKAIDNQNRKRSANNLPGNGYEDGDEDPDEIFDFIIVGGGSSGCVLANRLSEHFKVLVLDAGGTPSPLLSIPVYSYFLYGHDSIDWGFKTEPQQYAAKALNNNQSHWAAGRTLGGSSTINGMIYIRGNVQGFDEMARNFNDSNWSLSNVLKFYKKVENYNGWFEKSAHGTSGQLSIERKYLSPFISYMFKSANELGYRVRDPNPDGPNTEGFAPMDFYANNGRRSDAFHNSLLPAMLERPNKLQLHKYAYVTEILFKPGSENEVIGVKYDRHGKTFVAKARREVILSAGAIQTPRILMLSGIGPKNHLNEIGIPVRVDLPVGGRLQDKYGALIGPFIVSEGTSFVNDREVRPSTALDWFINGQGPVATARSEATYTIKSSIQKKDPNHSPSDAPDIHTYILSASTDRSTEFNFAKAFNLRPEAARYYGKALGNDSFLQLVTLNKPIGHGYIKLRDKDPYSALVIDPKYLEVERDLDVLVDGLKFATRLVETTKAFREINGHLMQIPFPGCELHVFKSDEYFKCLAQHSTLTAYKYCGTAPVGVFDKNNNEAVVDTRLRVFGTRNLRVIDGSVLQQKYTSQNDVTARMLAELGASIILKEYLLNN